MKTPIYIKLSILIIVLSFITSCEDFIEVEAPDNKIISGVVFNSDDTAMSALKGLYNQLFRATFISGNTSSVTVMSELLSDNLQCISATDYSRLEFEQNNLLPSNEHVSYIWLSAYNVIYMTNALLEGIHNSNELSEEIKIQIEGEAKFIRAFSYFYLVNLYGDVPLLLTTDYRVNSLASRNSEDEVYEQIINDLQESMELLDGEYRDNERIYANHFTAAALMSRVCLYQQNWEMAVNLSTQVIEATGNYEIIEDFDQIFLANSREAIWQLSPIGRGGRTTHTNEGASFIIHPTFPSLSKVKLSNDLVSQFSPQDLRLSNWISFHTGISGHYAFKYKIRNSTAPISEYSMVLRLAEQHLIKAEALAMMGHLPQAIANVDRLRKRAGITLVVDIDPEIGKEALLDTIMVERRKELFAEWGHRWFDLKRTGLAGEILGVDNPFWQETDLLLPIPEEERMKNPNLSQNEGY